MAGSGVVVRRWDMAGLCNTAPVVRMVCTRCQDNPRMPKQRYCRQCMTATQRDRRAARRAARAADATAPVTHAAIQAMPCLPQGEAQALDTAQDTAALPDHTTATPVSTPVTQVQRRQELAQAWSVYTNAELAYRLATRCIWPLLPPAPDLRVHHLWQRVKLSKQRWLALVEEQRDAAGGTTTA
jgi:hypothetical protein